MKRHINLMSNRSCARTCVRKRIGQWSATLTLLIFLLVPTWFVLWLPVSSQRQHVASLEAKYEPFRQMNRASKEFKERIERIRAQEKISLALAKIDTPVVTLLGLVGKSVAESEGRVFVEELEFQQTAPVLSGREKNATSSISIKGRGKDKESVARLTKSMKAALPFADVKLKSSQTVFINQQKMEHFFLQCSF